MKWIEALKIWNNARKNTDRWCIPRKGTYDYNEVKKIMKRDETKKTSKAPEPKAPEPKAKAPEPKAPEPKSLSEITQQLANELKIDAYPIEVQKRLKKKIESQAKKIAQANVPDIPSSKDASKLIFNALKKMPKNQKKELIEFGKELKLKK